MPSRPRSNAIEILRTNWKQIIADVNLVNKAAAALLRSCQAFDIVGNAIQLRADHDLIKQRLEDLLQPRAIFNLIQGRLPAPDDDLREPMRARIRRAEHFNQMGYTASGAQIGGVNAESHAAFFLARPGALH